MKYFFDSYAIIELINQNSNYAKYGEEEKIVTNALNIGEVYYYLLKVHNKQTADYWVRTLSFELLPIKIDAAIEASAFRFEHKKKQFSYPDCVGYVSALRSNLIFLTGDREFKGLPNVEFVK